MSVNDHAIGVFDSGVGGLTVLDAIRTRLPNEHTLYLGDTARVPYGTKSPATVESYAIRATAALVDRGIKALVIACNTATAHALPTLRERWPHLPIIGVVEPGVEAALKIAEDRSIVVLSTEGTARSGIYQNAIAARSPSTNVVSIPCSLFVALAEEGWIDGPIPLSIARAYLDSALDDLTSGCIVLGCTHFPPLAKVIAQAAPSGFVVLDSAHTTADAVANVLYEKGILRSIASGDSAFLATDAPDRFYRIAPHFLRCPIERDSIELIDLP